MSVCYNSSFDYANNKLSGSIVRLDKDPVLVNQVNTQTGLTSCKILGTKENIAVPLKELNLDPVPLGYCNSVLTSYVYRIPVRNWKQGLRMEFLGSKKYLPDVNSSAFLNMVHGIYPTIEDCCNEILSQECDSKAFHRKFALGRDLKKIYSEDLQFLYKDMVIGVFRFKKSIFPELLPKYQYLKEAVEDAIYCENS